MQHRVIREYDGGIKENIKIQKQKGVEEIMKVVKTVYQEQGLKPNV